LEVGFVIGLDPELSPLIQTAKDGLQKLLINDPAREMPPLRPGIRKI
jgi:hypothetical protein